MPRGKKIRRIDYNRKEMMELCGINSRPTFNSCMDKLCETYGFEIEDFGSGSILVRKAPLNFTVSVIESVIIEIAGFLIKYKDKKVTDFEMGMLFSIACKAAIKANHRMTPLEMEKLAEDIFAMKDYNTCPHGRPIVVSLTKYQIEKMFKRIP